MEKCLADKPLISVAVPIYEAEKHLNRCIDSIINQTYKNLEIILINDGSLDKSPEICNKYATVDNRIKVIHKANGGVSSARNCGIKNCLGIYIMFVDADDYIEPNTIEIMQLNACKHNSDYVMCNLVCDVFDAFRQKYKSASVELKCEAIKGNLEIAQHIVYLFENERINGSCCKLIARHILIKNNILFRENISLQEDLYFNIDILSNINSMVILNDKFYHYIKAENQSVTQKYIAKKLEMQLEVHKRMTDYYAQRIKDRAIIQRINYIYIKNVYAGFINLFHKDCKLSKKAKQEYIKAIIASEDYRYYIHKSKRNGLKYLILLWILKSENYKLIYFISFVFYILKNKFDMRY